MTSSLQYDQTRQKVDTIGAVVNRTNLSTLLETVREALRDRFSDEAPSANLMGRPLTLTCAAPAAGSPPTERARLVTDIRLADERLDQLRNDYFDLEDLVLRLQRLRRSLPDDSEGRLGMKLEIEQRQQELEELRSELERVQRIRQGLSRLYNRTGAMAQAS